MKNLLRLAVLTLVVVAPVLAQTAQNNQEAKTAAYTAFYNAVQAKNMDEAYRLGKDYLSKYGAEKDQYTDYIRTTVEGYEKGQRVGRIGEILTAISLADPKKADYNKAFTTGKQFLQTEPDNLNVLINLGYAGYAAGASNNGNSPYNQDAIGYATRAVNLIEQGKKPEDLYPDQADLTEFYPFKTRDEALAYLNFALGEMNLKSNPTEAARYYAKAASYNTPVKTTPVVYQRLAIAYENAYNFNRKAQEFQAKYGGKEATPESDAAQQALFPTVDLLMDAHARVVAYSGNEQQYQAAKNNSNTLLTGYYQFRNDNKTDGLQQFIEGVRSKPLPDPAAVIAAAQAAQAAAAAQAQQNAGTGTTGGTTGTSATQGGSTNGTTGATNGNANSNANTGANTTRPAANTSNANGNTRPTTPPARQPSGNRQQNRQR